MRSIRALHLDRGGFHMSIRLLATLGAAALVCACSGSEQKTLQVSDARVAALFNSPSGVACIELIATTPTRTATKTFSVAPGQSTAALTINGVPTGTVMFSGQGFDVPCGFVVVSTEPTWIADDVTVQVSAGTTVSVQLKFHGKATAIVGGNFTGDAYTVTTIAGVGGAPGTVDGLGAAARFAGPNSAALSADGTKLYVGDRNLDQNSGSVGMAIRQVDLNTGAVTTLAGSLTALGTADGPGATARFNRLFSVALSGSSLIIADRCAIRSMSTTAPFNVTTLVGTRAADPSLWDCRPAVSPLGAQDLDVAVRGTDVYAADATRFVVWKVAFAFTPPVISLVAGVPDSPGSDDGAVASAHLLGPNGLVFPFVGNDIFYLVDTNIFIGYGLIRRISLGEDSVTTVAGAPQTGFVSTDGLGTQALFAQPRRAVSDGSSLFIGDAFSVRRMDLATNAVVTIAGDMTSFGFADGAGGVARFNAAFGIARDSRSGAIYVADQGNFAIRKLTPP